jgi:vanillate O-demethylase monooxygenase subunit
MSYLLDCWYVAAWDHEINSERPLGRVLLDEPVALYRGADGTPHALSDRCPHRFAPLHLGKVCGDSVQCAYHGLEFGPQGNCTRNPHGNGVIPVRAAVRSYPVVERYSIIWIWMGRPELADPSTIPHFDSLDPQTYFVGKDYLRARANYQLEVDNIMDLSHIDYLHPGTLGGGVDKNAETRVVQEGNRVWSYRLARNERLSPELESRNRLEPGTRVDRWLDVRWDPPGVMELQVGFALAGAPDPRSSGKYRLFQHLFTPETQGTAHYWFASSVPRAEGPHGESLIAEVVAFLRRPFETEDLPMLEAQQLAMRGSGFWELNPILLPGDAASVRARRVLDQLIAQEKKGQGDGRPAPMQANTTNTISC